MAMKPNSNVTAFLSKGATVFFTKGTDNTNVARSNVGKMAMALSLAGAVALAPAPVVTVGVLAHRVDVEIVRRVPVDQPRQAGIGEQLQRCKAVPPENQVAARHAGVGGERFDQALRRGHRLLMRRDRLPFGYRAGLAAPFRSHKPWLLCQSSIDSSG
jgi:hypothetical protein